MKVVVVENNVTIRTEPTPPSVVIRVAEQGPQGNQTFHIGPNPLPNMTAPYVWLQTGLGDGSGTTLWYITP